MPYLEVQLTKKLERVYDIAGRMTLGRAPECQVQILSRAVSRRHAAVAPTPEGVVLEDLGAANGVKVNGAKLPSKSTRLLADGDQVVVGDVPMTFRAASRALQVGDSLDVRSGVAEDVLRAHLERPRASFTLPNDPAYLANFQQSIARERIERLTVSDESKLKLQIALAELIENAITHGAGGDASKPIQVLFEENEEEFRMTVRDLGPGFDAEAVLAGAEEIDALAATRERASFGPKIGLRMVLDCVDRLQFETAPGRGCAVHVGKYRDEDAGMLVIEDEDAPPDSDDPDANG